MSDSGHEQQHHNDHDRDGAHEGEHGLISRLFGHGHGTAEQTDSALESSARGMRVVALSLGALGLTAIVQLVIAIASGSVGLSWLFTENGSSAKPTQL